MVYYTHSVIEDYIIFDYITHSNDFFVYKLYNQNYNERAFILIYHSFFKFNVISEYMFDLENFKKKSRSIF